MELTEDKLERSEGAASELSPSQDELDLLPVRKIFDLNDSSQDKNLALILGWAQSNGLNNQDDIRLAVRRAEMKLGTNIIGENRVSRLANYLVLDGKLNNVLKEMQTFEK